MNLNDKVENNKNWFEKNWIILFFLIFIVIITYINSLNNAFVSDDIAEIAKNPKISNFSTIWSIPLGFARPLLYWIAYHIGGLNPIAFRLINVFFHIGSVCLIYLILNTLYNKRVAFFASSLFAVHPLLGEPVVWISGGAYIQYTFFFLLSFFAYIISNKHKSTKFFILSIFFYILSLISHPVMSIALSGIFFLYELQSGNFKKGGWKKLIIFFALSVFWIFYNLNSLPEREATLQSVHYQEKGVDNPLIIIPVAISNYFQLLIWPKDLTLYHSELQFTSFEFVLRAFFTLIFFGVIIYSFFKNKIIFFWSSFFFITLSPTLTPFRLNWVVAERYIYLPSLGIFVIFAWGLNKLLILKKELTAIFIILFFTILSAFSTRTIIRNIDWKNEDNLWIATGKTSPSSPNTHNNLGDVYGRWGNKQKALEEFQTAIVLKPNYADAYHNLANTYHEMGNDKKALENYQKAVSFNPNLWQSYQNIASIYFGQKKYDKALEFIQKAISVNPKEINLYSNLGIVYLITSEKEKAKQIFSKVLSADPQNIIARQGLLELSR